MKSTVVKLIHFLLLAQIRRINLNRPWLLVSVRWACLEGREDLHVLRPQARVPTSSIATRQERDRLVEGGSHSSSSMASVRGASIIVRASTVSTETFKFEMGQGVNRVILITIRDHDNTER